MPRKCKVCSSPNRLEYEKLYLERKLPITEIWNIALHKYNEDISYYAFQRHFKNHVEFYLKLQKRIKEEKERLYQRIIKKDIQAADRLAKNLEICSDKINELVKKKDLTPKDHEILLKWLTETRLLAEKILEWGNKVDFSPPEDTETLIDVIKKIVADFPEEYQIMLVERLDNYVREKYNKAS